LQCALFFYTKSEVNGPEMPKNQNRIFAVWLGMEGAGRDLRRVKELAAPLGAASGRPGCRGPGRQ
jgi:hypothetical protein